MRWEHSIDPPDPGQGLAPEFDWEDEPRRTRHDEMLDALEGRAWERGNVIVFAQGRKWR